jgi:nucleotide-binding universal stress UspA family protein
MDIIKHILVVSWLTPNCNNTIQFGISLSSKYQAELSVVHVMDTTWLTGWSIPMVSMEEEHKRELEKNKENLHNIISIENKRDRVIKEFVREGTPSEVILKIIKEENIDLLILRGHEGSRLERLLVGGSNDELIRAMPCSIFLVKQEPCLEDEDKGIDHE